MSDIEKQLIKAIKASGMSLNQLATMADISEGILSRFVNAKRGITLTTASKLIDVLGLELKPSKTSKRSDNKKSHKRKKEKLYNGRRF